MSGDLPGFDSDVMTRYTVGPAMEEDHYNLVRKSDPSSRKHKYRPMVEIRIFDLTDQNDREAYTEIMQQAADGQVHLIDVEPPRAENGYKSFVQWAKSHVLPGDR